MEKMNTEPFFIQESDLTESRLLRDIAENKFQMLLQPVFDFSGNLIEAEALIRYVFQKRIISPEKFISRLEDLNLIFYIDLFMFEEVCIHLKRGKEENLTLYPISINLSRKTLSEENIIEHLECIRERNQISSEYLILEVTETAKTKKYEQEKKTIAELKRKGYILSLDDFGMDYSNLKSLVEYPYSYIKIDKSLVDGVETNWKDRILLENVISVCHQFGMKVISEGVENEYQYEFFQEKGCDMLQGYYMDIPLNPSDFEMKYCRKAGVSLV